MPQMSAMNWIILLMMFIISLLMMSCKLYNFTSSKLNFLLNMPYSTPVFNKWSW
uniref:ATP synthase F0 subunit 8 n=1 Tax=Bilobella aurantiaca TaxID=106915 RepID=B5KMC3_BILAU|nr:ATP synthase F0 subunit 8 [Bilobella aurantiaca]ABS88966.1 ATP synthase F0 subunit 8 [Bilobella aurantiaca]